MRRLWRRRADAIKLTYFVIGAALMIEIYIEYKKKIIFSAIFDTDDGAFEEFRAVFRQNFVKKFPNISFECADIRETWHRVQARPPAKRASRRRAIPLKGL